MLFRYLYICLCAFTTTLEFTWGIKLKAQYSLSCYLDNYYDIIIILIVRLVEALDIFIYLFNGIN